jgi:hypothetical protein
MDFPEQSAGLNIGEEKETASVGVEASIASLARNYGQRSIAFNCVR